MIIKCINLLFYTIILYIHIIIRYKNVKYIITILILSTAYSCNNDIDTITNKTTINNLIDLKYNGNFNGQVFDRKGLEVEGVMVNAKSIDSNINWVSENKITNKNGEYSFNNAPVGVRLSITISKDGINKTKTEVIETGINLKNNPLINTFNFNSYYSLDATLIKIFLFDEQKNEVKNAIVKIESLSENFNFVREYTVQGENIVYSSSKEPLPINTRFKITVKSKSKEKEQIITTEPIKIYNEINFII